MMNPGSASVASEIVNLLLILVLVPLTLATVRKMSYPGRDWLLAGYLIMAGIGVWSVVERFLGNPTTIYKQFAFSAAGILFAIGVWELALALRRREVL
jgi:hypothetical protein